MLKTTDYKKGDRQIGAQRPTGEVLPGQREKNPEGDQYIAKQAEENGVSKGQSTLSGGRLHGKDRQSTGGVVHLTGKGTTGGHGQRTGKISEVHQPPVAEHSRCAGPLIQYREKKERVSGKKLGASEDHHSKTKGEEQS